MRHEVSAFLTAARTVLPYAHREAVGKPARNGKPAIAGKPGGQQWYDDAITRDPVIAFLSDHRNTDIHE
jgi:hypothetical protein